jgi:TM2 domain-containing membrane protein YozV
MNCANHPDAAVSAYCQQCGKPLCSQCVRPVSGLVYCETCLAARLGVPPVGAPGATVAPPPGAYGAPASGGAPNPGLAAFLGFIPGVGAMYNGQFVKALVHVLVFAVLVSLADQHGIFGLFIAAWVFYQVFDAYQTAKARRDGLPLPDPFGLNELGQRIGIQPTAAPHTNASSRTVPPKVGVPPASYEPVPPSSQPYTSVSPSAPGAPVELPVPSPSRHPEPVGAIILIALGLLFLLHSLGVLGSWWIGHSWPWILIALGAWLVFRRLSDTSGGAQ